MTFVLVVFLFPSTCSSFRLHQSLPATRYDLSLSPLRSNNYRRCNFPRLQATSSRSADSIELKPNGSDETSHDSTLITYNTDLNEAPKTLPLLKSVKHFVQYTLQYLKENKQERKRYKQLRRLSKLSKGKVEVVDTILPPGGKELEKMSIRQTLQQLNNSRKNLISLVGYDASLLVPSFSFLLFGAIFESIRPHYWSKCITFVVSGESQRNKVIQALVGLSMSSLLGALFTGLRGAMFWIAGK